MKRAFIILLFVLPLAAQGPKLAINLDHLASKASEKVSITLDGSLLQLGAKFLDNNDPDSAKIKGLVQGLSGIYLRSFEFDSDNAFSSRDYEDIRKQLEAPGWSCIISVRTRKEKGEDADICLYQKDGKISGLALLAVEPRQLTVVNILGSITPEQFKDLQGFAGIPHIEGLDKELEKKKSAPPRKDEE